MPGVVETMTVCEVPRAYQTLCFLEILTGTVNKRALMEFVQFTPQLRGTQLVRNLYKEFSDLWRKVPCGNTDQRMTSFCELFDQNANSQRLLSWAKNALALFNNREEHKAFHFYCEPFLVAQTETSVKQWRSESSVPMLLDRLMERTETLKDLYDDSPAIVTFGELEEWIEKQASGFRLAKMWEWQYLSHGGTKTEYFWGDDNSKRSQFVHALKFNAKEKEIQSTKINLNQSNAFGISDTIGNAYEWIDVDWTFWQEIWPDWVEATPKFQTILNEHDAGMIAGGQYRSGGSFANHEYFILSEKNEERVTPRKGSRIVVSLR